MPRPALTYLTVFATSDLTNDFILFLVAPIHGQSFVIPVISGSVYIDIGVDAENRGGKRKMSECNELPATNRYSTNRVGLLTVHGSS